MKLLRQEPDYSFRECILTWVATTAGCHLDWFSRPPANISTTCTTTTQVSAYNQALSKAQKARWLQLQRMTGCVPKCRVR